MGLPLGVPKLLAGSTALGVEKSMSSAVARTICMASSADSTLSPGRQEVSAGLGAMSSWRA